MRRDVYGLDPAFGCTGIAFLSAHDDDDSAPKCVLRSIGGLPSPMRTFAERIWPAISATCKGGDQLFIERPPPVAHSDVQRASQADIGFATGFIGGMVAGAWLARGLAAPVVVEVSDWRHTMVIEAGRMRFDLFGELASRTSPRLATRVSRVVRAIVGFSVEFACGLSWAAKDFTALQSKPDICPVCAAEGSTAHGEHSRERWKRGACRFVAAKWPDPYKALVEDARSRANSVGQEDAKLVGVADACEAAAIAFHGLEMIRGGLCVSS